ncbi:MAG: hypothetical protein AB8B55_22345 [Mariniblastus sp.]
MNKNTQVEKPWDAPAAIDWLATFDPWLQTLRLVHGTLQMEVREKPNEIRAAAAMVILFCRENLWPTRVDNKEEILSLAARQLSTLKQLYEGKARIKPELLSNRQYRDLLRSLDEEIRIIESRMTDPKPVMPNEPPCTWGDFWTQ